MIEPSKHIIDITTTISQMYKVLCSNLSLDVQQIEENVIEGALEQVMKLLEKLYIDSLKDSNSKYAKKRIQVDIKVLLKNL